VKRYRVGPTGPPRVTVPGSPCHPSVPPIMIPCGKGRAIRGRMRKKLLQLIENTVAHVPWQPGMLRHPVLIQADA